MTKRVVATLLFVSAFITAPAHAGEILATISGKLFGAAYNAVTSGISSGVGAVVKGATSSDTPQERTVGAQQDVEALADQMLQGYPEDQRAQLRPQLIEKLTKAQSRYQEQAQQVVVDRLEQQQAGATVLGAVVPQSVGNRAVFDAAERAAYSRQRIGIPANPQAAVQVVSVLGRLFGFGKQHAAKPETQYAPQASLEPQQPAKPADSEAEAAKPE